MSSIHDIKGTVLKEAIARTKEFGVDSIGSDDLMFRKRIEQMVKVIIKDANISVNHEEREEVLSEIISHFIGLGPIEKLMKDPSVTEIMVNGPKEVYVEISGKLEPTDVTFKDEDQLAYFLERILSPVGRRITEYEPYVDARLKDGSRVNIVRSPVSQEGSIVTIRKFSTQVLSSEDLIKTGTINSLAKDFLEACVIARMNILISGGAGSGKTTLLNMLSSFIPKKERVITIEDTRELRLTNKHVVSMETRPCNIEGKGEITIRNLVRNALHMRPDRIIVGEVRSDEVMDMVQAMNTGHDGSMTTLHANATQEALDRLEILALMGGPNMSSEVARRQIINAVDMIIHMSRFPDGSRKLISVAEIVKTKDYMIREILSFSEETNELKFTDIIPVFSERLKKGAGYDFKANG